MENNLAILDANLVSSLFAASGTTGGIAAHAALNDLISLHPSVVVSVVRVFRNAEAFS